MTFGYLHLDAPLHVRTTVGQARKKRVLAGLGSALAAVALTTAAGASGQPLRPVATYGLPARPQATYGACSVGANASYAAIGLAWARSPIPAEYDHFCRGFTLVTLRTGTRRVAVRLPLVQQKGSWAVDEPVLTGHWLAYLHYIKSGGGPWDVEIVNLQTGASHRLAHGDGQSVSAGLPLITNWRNSLVWVSAGQHVNGHAVDQIHTYDPTSSTGRVVVTSRPGIHYANASMSGPIVTFLGLTHLGLANRGSDVWVKDLRTGHLRQLTHTGKATGAVVTGPWVAWYTIGRNDVGPVIVEDLRTGRRWTATRDPSYQVTAGNGLLAWDSIYKDQWTVLDLTTGRSWTPPKLSARQGGGTLVYVQGDVVVERAVNPASEDVGFVQVFGQRSLPSAPRL